MQVTLEDISETTARALMNQAAASDLTVEEYLQRLLGIASSEPQAGLDTTPTEEVNAFMADLETLADETDHLPSTPLTYSREDIYFDHD